MRYKTPFRLAIQAIGILMIAQAAGNLLSGATSWFMEGFDSGFTWSPFIAQTLVYSLSTLGCGLFLIVRAKWIAGLVIPAAHRYCNECGYNLTRASLEGDCPECGTPFSRTTHELIRDLRLRWRELHRRLAPRADSLAFAAVFDDLRTRYQQPNRTYHNLHHIAACLHLLDQCKDESTYSDLVELTIWFHDAVYDPQRSDNEQQSAALAVEHARAIGLVQSHVQALECMILATRHIAPPIDTDDELVMDIDLSILGAPENEYDRYAARIRQEYSFASDAEYRAGRAEVLRGFLGRRRIFSTARLRARFETPARANLARELEELEHA